MMHEEDDDPPVDYCEEGDDVPRYRSLSAKSVTRAAGAARAARAAPVVENVEDVEERRRRLAMRLRRHYSAIGGH
tara:strand:- start:498 stop:722 length:225 start_codon:yes stop_codon:yes gene_type:complete